MTKIGVGVGEDFPVDEGAQRPQPGPHSGPEPEGHPCYDHDAWRQWRRQRYEWRRQWRAEWRSRRRAFKEQLRQSIYENFGPEAEAEFRHRHHWPHVSLYALVPVLAIAGGIAVLIALIDHPLVLLALIGGAILFAVWKHRRFEDFAFEPAPGSAPSPEPRDAAH